MSALTAGQAAFLAEPHYGILATIGADGVPHQTVVWYLPLEDGTIYVGMAAHSVKARNARRDPRVTLTVTTGPKYLTIVGSAALGPPDDELRRRCAERYLGPERLADWLARPAAFERTIMRITVERAYGQGV